MPTKNPRVSVTLDEELLEILKVIAEKRKENLSQTIRRLLLLGLSLSEDVGLSQLAEERLKDFVKEKALNHEEVWD
jgi:metal-responsive CopG/Arc/MetJ family transcriptional regulator